MYLLLSFGEGWGEDKMKKARAGVARAFRGVKITESGSYYGRGSGSAFVNSGS